MRILIISYFFAPVGGVATERIRKFTKYLPEFGWDPVILTQTIETYRLLKPKEIDENISMELPDELVIHRVPSPVFGHPQSADKEKTGKVYLVLKKLLSIARRIVGIFLIPDQHILWAKSAVRAGSQIIKRKDIDLIFATGPSFTSFVVGALLNKFTGCPLILDYRDPWALNSIFFPRSPVRRLMNRQLEKWCLSRASTVLFATAGFRQLYVDRYPSLSSRCHVISNGYDGDIIEYQPHTKPHHEEPIIIGYAGKMFGDQYPVSEFFQAIAILVKEQGDNVIQVHMAGAISSENKKVLADENITDVVQLKGYLHKSEVETMLSKSDVLLIIIGDTHPFLFGLESAKLYEYLRFRRPILGLVPRNGVVWQFIGTNHLGLVSPPSKVGDIVHTLQTLIAMIRKPKDNSIWNGSINNNIEHYHRRALTSELANLCTSIVNQV